MRRFSDLNLPAKNWTSSCAQDTLGMIKVKRAICRNWHEAAMKSWAVRPCLRMNVLG